MIFVIQINDDDRCMTTFIDNGVDPGDNGDLINGGRVF